MEFVYCDKKVSTSEPCKRFLSEDETGTQDRASDVGVPLGRVVTLKDRHERGLVRVIEDRWAQGTQSRKKISVGLKERKRPILNLLTIQAKFNNDIKSIAEIVWFNKIGFN
jgi:hypothetical protein